MKSNVYLRHYVTKKKEKRYRLIVRERGRKDHNIYLGCISKKLAEQRRVMVLSQLLNGTYDRPIQESSLLFSEFSDKFIEEFAKGQRAPATVKQYRYNLDIAERALRGLRLDKIQRYDIERFLNTWRVKGRSKNIMLSTLRLFFQKAVDWRYLSESPAHGIRRAKEESQGSRALTQKELDKLLSVATPWVQSIVMVMVYSGLRPGEVSQLKFEHIDWENKMLRVLKTKTGKKRAIPICTDLETELRRLEEYWPNQQYGSNGDMEKYLTRSKEQGAYVFCHRDGRPCHNFRRSLIGAFRKAGIDGVSPHGLRKTFCSMLARHGVHPKAAQELMGHSDIELTMRVYTEVGDDQLRAAVNSLPSRRDIQKERFHIVKS